MFLCIIILYVTTNGEVAILSQELYVCIHTSVVCCSSVFMQRVHCFQDFLSFFIRIVIKLCIM